MKILSNNKKAYHDFFVSDTLTAGICLEGSEVKSVRSFGMNIDDCFIQIKNGEMFLKNAYIKPYGLATSFAPDSRKTRKLLLNKTEILKFERKTKEKGFTIIPLKVFMEKNLVKLEIGLARGKKLYDKRETLKEKAVKRHIEQESKQK